MDFLVPFLLWFGLFGALGWFVARTNGHDPGVGLLLGGVFGPFGVFVLLFLKPPAPPAPSPAPPAPSPARVEPLDWVEVPAVKRIKSPVVDLGIDLRENGRSLRK